MNLAMLGHGVVTVWLTGNTYPYRQEIRNRGATWDAQGKRWQLITESGDVSNNAAWLRELQYHGVIVTEYSEAKATTTKPATKRRRRTGQGDPDECPSCGEYEAWEVGCNDPWHSSH